VLAFVLAAAAVGDSVESFEAGPCDTEVAKANTECTAANAAHRKTAKDTCGTADYDARMKKVAELQKLAGNQNSLISGSKKAVQAAKANAAKVASASGEERTSLLTMLSKQKALQAALKKTKAAAADNRIKMKDMKGAADTATAAAVTLAGQTSDLAKVLAAKAKAHTTYQKYVDQEIQMAQMQRKVTVAHKALDEQTTKVEKEIAKAKVTADKEAAALRGIAQSKADLTNEAKVQAVMNARASEKALQAAANSAHLLTGKESKAAGDITTTQANLNAALAAEKAAKDAASKVVDAAKGKKYTVDMPKLQLEAKAQVGNAYAPAPRVEPVKKPTHGDIHQQYAVKVKAIEKQRTAAAIVHKKALDLVSKLTNDGAPADKIARAKSDAKQAERNMETLVAQQNEAVAKVVAEIKSSPK